MYKWEKEFIDKFGLNEYKHCIQDKFIHLHIKFMKEKLNTYEGLIKLLLKEKVTEL